MLSRADETSKKFEPSSAKEPPRAAPARLAATRNGVEIWGTPSQRLVARALISSHRAQTRWLRLASLYLARFRWPRPRSAVPSRRSLTHERHKQSKQGTMIATGAAPLWATREMIEHNLARFTISRRAGGALS